VTIWLLRNQLGEPAFAKAWAAGRAMSIEQAVTHALEGGNGTEHHTRAHRGQP
jgi:hypothetical protein